MLELISSFIEIFNELLFKFSGGLISYNGVHFRVGEFRASYCLIDFMPDSSDLIDGFLQADVFCGWKLVGVFVFMAELLCVDLLIRV